ncbi:MAG: hypothetical protein V4850_37260 [Myxococcota bacterium]
MPSPPDPTVAVNTWVIPPELPRHSYAINDFKQMFDTVTQVIEQGKEPAVVEFVLPAGVIDFSIEVYDVPGVHVIVRGAGAATVLRRTIEVSDAASVEIRDLRFATGSTFHAETLNLDVTQHITLHNISFLDHRGTYTTRGHGVIPFDYVVKLKTQKGGDVHLSDLSLLGARGAYAAFHIVAPSGDVTIARTLVADTDRPPFYIGIADTILVEDSVLALPAGARDLLQTKWPPDGVTFRRSTILTDTLDVLVAPGNNLQAPPSVWLPTRLVDTTVYTRAADPGRGPGVMLERSTITTAPAADPDFAALRARAEALAPVERDVIVPLLGLGTP